jgi:hypothetical protein
MLVSRLRRWPRFSAAVAFGGAGGAVSILWWAPIIFEGGLLPWALFIGTPALSAALAGGLCGRRLLKGAVRSGPAAAIWGVAIASLALVFFAIAFSFLYVATQPPNEHWRIAGLMLIILIGSVVAVWWILALVGAAVAYLLYRLAAWEMEPE